MQSLDTLLKGEMKASENIWKNTDGFHKEAKICLYINFTEGLQEAWNRHTYILHVVFWGRTRVLKVSNSFILLHSFHERVQQSVILQSRNDKSNVTC